MDYIKNYETDLFDAYMKIHILNNLQSLSEKRSTRELTIRVDHLNEWIPVGFEFESWMKFLRSIEYVPRFKHVPISENDLEMITYMIRQENEQENSFVLHLSEKLESFLALNSEAIQFKMYFSLNVIEKCKDIARHIQEISPVYLPLDECIFYERTMDSFGKENFHKNVLSPLLHAMKKSFKIHCELVDLKDKKQLYITSCATENVH